MSFNSSELRPAKASELIKGGVFYIKNNGDSFSTVIASGYNDPLKFRLWVKEMSEHGRIYLRRDKPNYPLSNELDYYFEQQMQ